MLYRLRRQTLMLHSWQTLPRMLMWLYQAKTKIETDCSREPTIQQPRNQLHHQVATTVSLLRRAESTISSSSNDRIFPPNSLYFLLAFNSKLVLQFS